MSVVGAGFPRPQTHGDPGRPAGEWRETRESGARAMTWIALKMLTGDRTKYVAIVAGVTFAALLIAQQLSIACGLLLRTTSTIQDIADVDIFVFDPDVQFIDELKPLTENDLYRVKSVP